MFILQAEQFHNFQLDSASNFVSCWGQFYKGDTTKIFQSEDPINYEQELNLPGSLTEENVRRLLRWKDPQYFTEVILSGRNKDKPNQRVQCVVENLTTINNFRHGMIAECQFLDFAKSIYATGWIWRVFLFHMSRPLEYPIVDQHVFRAYECHTGCKLEVGWEKYLSYRKYFRSIISAYRQANRQQNELLLHKQVDNALMAFGQFLQKYA